MPNNVYGNGLDGAGYIPMQLDLDQADPGEFELTVLKRGAQPIPEPGKGEGLVPAFTLEPFLFFRHRGCGLRGRVLE